MMAVASVSLRKVDVMRSNMTYLAFIAGTCALGGMYGAAVVVTRLAGHAGAIDPMAAAIGYLFGMSGSFLAMTVMAAIAGSRARDGE